MQETVRNLDEAAIASAASAPVATFASPTAVRCVLFFFHLCSFQKVLSNLTNWNRHDTIYQSKKWRHIDTLITKFTQQVLSDSFTSREPTSEEF